MYPEGKGSSRQLVGTCIRCGTSNDVEAPQDQWRGDEKQDPELTKDQHTFDAEIRKELGKPLSPEKLKQIDVDAPTPE